jgi:hypothetical protein
LNNYYEEIVPQEVDWEDVQRFTYKPATETSPAEGARLQDDMKWSIWSLKVHLDSLEARHRWEMEHPGNNMDFTKGVLAEMQESEPDFKAAGDKFFEMKVKLEWGTVVLLARKRLKQLDPSGRTADSGTAGDETKGDETGGVGTSGNGTNSDGTISDGGVDFDQALEQSVALKLA